MQKNAAVKSQTHQTKSADNSLLLFFFSSSLLTLPTLSAAPPFTLIHFQYISFALFLYHYTRIIQLAFPFLIIAHFLL